MALSLNFNPSHPVGPEKVEEPVGPSKLEQLLEEQRKLEQDMRDIMNRRDSIQRDILQARRDEALNRQKEKAEREERERQERLAAIEAERAEKAKELEETARLIEENQPKAWANAHPYQKSAIISAYHNMRRGDSGFFNADDMGLGKTFQAISLIELYLRDNPKKNILWLTKSSIAETGGTEREIKQWSDLNVVSILGKEDKKSREFKIDLLSKHSNGYVIITNYEAMRTTPALQNAEFGMIVMDEVHKLKGGANPSGPTGLWKAIRNYIWGDGKNEPFYEEPSVDYILMLSGTPMVNRVAELWAYLHIFDPHRFESLKSFERAFDAYVEFGGKVQTGKILDMCLKDRMVRRTRDEVGLELPELTVEYRMVEYNPEQQAAYDQMKNNFFVWLDEQQSEALTTPAIIAQLTRLRQISVWPVFSKEEIDPLTGEMHKFELRVEDSAKVDEAMDIIEEANGQVVLFCNFNEVFNEIKKRSTALGLRCEFINSTTKARMGEFETAFQQGEIDVLCINSSMGEGLNLQKNPNRWPGGSSVAIHLDRWWNPARDEQCNARVHRQGDTKAVFIYMIHAPNSIDDFVKAISDEKGELFEGIMSGDQIRPAYEWKDMLKKVL